MYENRTMGSCTSAAIYLTTAYKAAGLPARTIICLPLTDGSDESEIVLAERLTNHEVRRIVLGAARKNGQSWASHTFNEVYINGRWRRLNYDNLGQKITIRKPNTWRLEISGGAIKLNWDRGPGTSAPGPTQYDGGRHSAPFEPWPRPWTRVNWPGLIMPLWLPAVLLAIPAAMLWRRRPIPGRCQRCGYDLTGLPAPTRCPECGGP